MRDVEVFYGKVQALRGMSLHVEEGEIVAVLGNNGAGKTTTLATISGLERATSGSIRYQDRDITTARPWTTVADGLVHVPEGRRIFSTMSVLENLQLGGFLVDDKKVVKQRIDHVYDLLPRLAARSSQQGGTLSGGEQQMVAIGRALVADPTMLMLDEPSMGLAPLVVASVMEVIGQINQSGTSVLLVEQNARAALRIADRAYVIASGAVTIEGAAAELSTDKRIVDAYLGA
nr:ABC transporter ATP-binding protein [Nocardioides panaciterrulae]